MVGHFNRAPAALAAGAGLARTIAMTGQTHKATRTILATPHAIFRAFVDPEVVTKWRAPAGMEARLEAFDPRPGGGYRMALRYRDPASATPKSPSDSDVVEARFVELLPDEQIVEAVTFASDDPRFAGTMTITTTLTPVTGGTKVSVIAANVPVGIAAADHLADMDSSLKNLANLLE